MAVCAALVEAESTSTLVKELRLWSESFVADGARSLEQDVLLVGLLTWREVGLTVFILLRRILGRVLVSALGCGG